MSITLEQAKNLSHGDTIYHKYDRNSNGTPRRWKVNGMVQTWKTRPFEVKVPIKHGLYSYAYLHHMNLSDFSLTEEEAMKGE